LNRSLFRKSTATKPSTQAGERIYAIGDVHGRFDLLARLLQKIEDHHAALPVPQQTHVVILGDMIDRGPGTSAVLNHLYNAQKQNSDIIVLLGNHEDLMLRALAKQPGLLRAWLRIGGDETLRSYGIEPPSSTDISVDFVDTILRIIPSDIRNWLSSLPVSARSGDYFFCHAGLRPGVPLKRQTRADMLWIRDEFLNSNSSHGVVVVHGHSIETDVEIRSNRIGLDSGAYRTGTLTAIYLEGTNRELINVEDDVASIDPLPNFADFSVKYTAL
jgi:serine/threonine protein phosphatase 1